VIQPDSAAPQIADVLDDVTHWPSAICSLPWVDRSSTLYSRLRPLSLHFSRDFSKLLCAEPFSRHAEIAGSGCSIPFCLACNIVKSISKNSHRGYHWNQMSWRNAETLLS